MLMFQPVKSFTLGGISSDIALSELLEGVPHYQVIPSIITIKYRYQIDFGSPAHYDSSIFSLSDPIRLIKSPRNPC